jgi:hypothetical protein
VIAGSVLICLVCMVVFLATVNSPSFCLDLEGFTGHTGNVLSLLRLPNVAESRCVLGPENILILNEAVEMCAKLSGIHLHQVVVFNGDKINSAVNCGWHPFDYRRNIVEGKHLLAAYGWTLFVGRSNQDGSKSSYIEGFSRPLLAEHDSDSTIKIADVRCHPQAPRVPQVYDDESGSVLVPLGVGSSTSFNGLPDDRAEGENKCDCSNAFGPCYEFVPPVRLIFALICLGASVAINAYGRGWIRILCLPPILCSGWLILDGHRYWCKGEDGNYREYSHDDKVYHKKSLTTYTFCNTVSAMTNVLSADKQTAIIAALAEGSSIRSIERITGVHRDTIMRLGVRVGKSCEMLLDSKMQGLGCNYLQLDEVWGFIGKKERHCRVDDNPEYSDLAGHATAHRVYAWAHETDDPNKPIRHVTVLHLHPIKSAQDAVRAAVMQEARNLGAEES